jgi:nucleotide-binding universal stress UspA family protein
MTEGIMNSTFKKILCPIDFTEDSFGALRAAYTLALCFSAHLIAVHVMPSTNQFRLPQNRPVHHRIVESYFEEQLNLAVRQWTEGNIRIDSMLLEGNPAEEIVRVASDLHVDAIVMAEQKKDDWEKIRDGSTSEEVAGQASCPVLILRDLEV